MKNNNTKSLLLGFFLVCQMITAKSQSLADVNFFDSPLQLNPAVMGANDNLRVNLDYRSQWASVSSGYTTMVFNGMYPIKVGGENSGKLDVGLFALQDAAGAFTTDNFGLAIDYNKEIAPNNNICVALSGGYNQQALGLSGLTFGNQYYLGSFNPGLSNGETILNQSVSYPVVNAGAMWYLNPSHNNSSMDAYFGFSAFNLNTPNQSLTGASSPLPILYSAQGGVKIFGEKNIDILPNAVVNMQSGNIKSAAGLTADYVFSDNAKLILGTWYGYQYGYSFMAGLEFKGLCIAYTYDVVTSTLTNQIPGGLNANELVLSYKLGKKHSTQPQIGNNSVPAPEPSELRDNPFPWF